MRPLTSLNLVIFLLCSTFSFAQEIQVGLGYRTEITSGSVLRFNKVVAYDQINSRMFIPLHIAYQYQLSDRFELISGVRYQNKGRRFSIYKDTTCSFCPIKKVKITGYRVLEFPQQAVFNFLRFGDFQIGALASITPVWQFDRSHSDYEGPVREPGWSPGVISVHNNLETVIKPWYFAYAYGLQLRYSQLRARIYVQENLGNSTTGPLRIEGNSYPFNTQALSFNLNLSYSFSLKRDEEVAPKFH